MTCGNCSWDGWIFVKEADGKWYARRCPCWLAQHQKGDA